METKIIKVTDKGQISIPVEIRNSIGIVTGDELIAVRNGETLCLRKIKKEEFRDMLKLSEISLKKMWDNKEDEIWNTYLKNDS
jgi:AbrB family looped-hinge helix DNA binding protein